MAWILNAHMLLKRVGAQFAAAGRPNRPKTQSQTTVSALNGFHLGVSSPSHIPELAPECRTACSLERRACSNTS